MSFHACDAGKTMVEVGVSDISRMTNSSSILLCWVMKTCRWYQGVRCMGQDFLQVLVIAESLVRFSTQRLKDGIFTHNTFLFCFYVQIFLKRFTERVKIREIVSFIFIDGKSTTTSFAKCCATICKAWKKPVIICLLPMLISFTLNVMISKQGVSSWFW